MNKPNTPIPATLSRELAIAIDAARATALTINNFYERRTAETYTKGDGSPVTDADIAADKQLREIISSAFPDDAFLTEEGAQGTKRLAHDRVWIIDPIDGTAQFIAGTGRFDVLIALAVKGQPVVAVTVRPSTGLMHAAVAGEGAWRITPDKFEEFHIEAPPHPPRIVGSKYYEGHEKSDWLDYIATTLGADAFAVMDVGFQPVAFDSDERFYDVFLGLPQAPGISPANEWDIAASDLIVNEAGGRFSDCWGRPYTYNKRNTHISGGVLASATPDLHDAVLKDLQRFLPPSAPAMDPADDLGV